MFWLLKIHCRNLYNYRYLNFVDVKLICAFYTSLLCFCTVIRVNYFRIFFRISILETLLKISINILKGWFKMSFFSCYNEIPFILWYIKKFMNIKSFVGSRNLIIRWSILLEMYFLFEIDLKYQFTIH